MSMTLAVRPAAVMDMSTEIPVYPVQVRHMKLPEAGFLKVFSTEVQLMLKLGTHFMK